MSSFGWTFLGCFLGVLLFHSVAFALRSLFPSRLRRPVKVTKKVDGWVYYTIKGVDREWALSEELFNEFFKEE